MGNNLQGCKSFCTKILEHFHSLRFIFVKLIEFFRQLSFSAF